MSAAVRQASEADVPGIMRLERLTFPLDAWSEQSMRAELASEHTQYLVVDDGGCLAGYAGALAPRGAADADIQTIAIAPAARRRGWATRLLGELAAWSESRGARHLFLEVREGAEAARALYGQLGFTEIGRRPRYYPGDGADAIVMRAETRSVALAARGESVTG